MKTERKQDMKAEGEVNKFLSNFFYGRISSFYETVTDFNGQIKGTDTRLNYNGQIINIDEKCQLNGLNRKDISTQCLEIGSYNKAHRYQNGWFVADKDTEYYLFTWIPECSVQHKNQLTCDSIQVMEAMLVSKKKLEEHLETSFGINKEVLHHQGVRMLSGFRDRKYIKTNQDGSEYQTNYIYFRDEHGNQIRQKAHVTMSLGMGERPINLVVYFTEYAKIYEDHFVITKNTIYSTKEGKLIWQAQKN